MNVVNLEIRSNLENQLLLILASAYGRTSRHAARVTAPGPYLMARQPYLPWQPSRTHMSHGPYPAAYGAPAVPGDLWAPARTLWLTTVSHGKSFVTKKRALARFLVLTDLGTASSPALRRTRHR